MYNFFIKRGQMLAFGLGVVVSLIFLLSVFGGLEEFNALAEEDRGTTNIFNFGLIAGQWMTVICAIIAAVFGVYHVATNFKESKKGILGLAVVAILFAVLYSTSDGTLTGSLAETAKEFNVTEGQSKFISGSIRMAIGMALIATVTFIVSEIINIFK